MFVRDKHSSLFCKTISNEKKRFLWDKGMYYKTLRARKLQKTAKFHSKLVSFLFSVTNTLVWTNTLAYCGIRRLRFRNVFIIQAPSACPLYALLVCSRTNLMQLLTSVIYKSGLSSLGY
jgi:hypothetical protein